MTKREANQIERMARTHGLEDFKWIQPKMIVTGYWVRTKCNYGCPSYGKRACCPPELPSFAECQKFLAEYQSGLLFHFAVKLRKPEMRHPWGREINKKMLDLEKEVFLSGFYKAFVFPANPCRICERCKESKPECRNPGIARPTLEGFCVDVYATARKMGYPIQVLKGYKEEMNRFGLLLVE
jgi:predicted metal-binding protein